MPKAQTQAEIFENAGLSPFTEDTHAALLGELAINPDYDIIQLDPVHDPDVVGLIVCGELRVAYRKEAEYAPASSVAREILSRVRRQAVAAHTLVRNFGRVVQNAPAPARAGSDGELHRSVDEESASFEVPSWITDGPPDINDTQPLDLPEVYKKTGEERDITYKGVHLGEFVEKLHQVFMVGTQEFEPLSEEIREGYQPEDMPDWEEGWE